MKKKALIVHTTYSENGPDLQTILADMFRTFLIREYRAMITASKETADPRSTL